MSPQGNYLFTDIKRKYSVNKPNATDKEIKEALEISDIYDFVMQPSKGA